MSISMLLKTHSYLRTPNNNVLIRSGGARLVGWSRLMLYSGFNILPRSVLWSANLNGRSDNTDVMWAKHTLIIGAGLSCDITVSKITIGEDLEN